MTQLDGVRLVINTRQRSLNPYGNTQIVIYQVKRCEIRAKQKTARQTRSKPPLSFYSSFTIAPGMAGSGYNMQCSIYIWRNENRIESHIIQILHLETTRLTIAGRIKNLNKIKRRIFYLSVGLVRLSYPKLDEISRLETITNN